MTDTQKLAAWFDKAQPKPVAPVCWKQVVKEMKR